MSDFTPSPAMVEAVGNAAWSATSRTEAAIAATVEWLADPAHAEDARRWADATMDLVEEGSRTSGSLYRTRTPYD